MYVFSKTIGLRDPEETSANGVQSCFPVLHPLWGIRKPRMRVGLLVFLVLIAKYVAIQW